MQSGGARVWFPSKVDTWVAVLLAGAPLAVVLGPLLQGDYGDDPAGLWLSGFAFLFLVGIYGLLVFPMRYGVGEEELTVRAGLLRWRVPLGQIESVRPSRSPFSSPALSLNRLEVRWGRGLHRRVLISPRDRERFLGLLAERTGLVRRGDSLAAE